MNGPGSMARYVERKRETQHAALRAEVQTKPQTFETWRAALLSAGDQAEALAESCRRDALFWESQGDANFAEYMRSEADRTSSLQ
jgi:hypothetical protein